MKTNTEMPLFEMKDSHIIARMNLHDAKNYLNEKMEARKDYVYPKSLSKGRHMVNKCTSVQALMFGVSNFVLAFSGSTYKTIKR